MPFIIENDLGLRNLDQSQAILMQRWKDDNRHHEGCPILVGVS